MKVWIKVFDFLGCAAMWRWICITCGPSQNQADLHTTEHCTTYQHTTGHWCPLGCVFVSGCVHFCSVFLCLVRVVLVTDGGAAFHDVVLPVYRSNYLYKHDWFRQDRWLSARLASTWKDDLYAPIETRSCGHFYSKYCILSHLLLQKIDSIYIPFSIYSWSKKTIYDINVL